MVSIVLHDCPRRPCGSQLPTLFDNFPVQLLGDFHPSSGRPLLSAVTTDAPRTLALAVVERATLPLSSSSGANDLYSRWDDLGAVEDELHPLEPDIET
jgi:hypothetical protein